ncbi:MAG TPA: ComEA family DNA-binding protein [Fibrobacteria bacterium]|nr:ComEA family DNA-binding protein [Fibrobacteria bacterium]
MFSRGEIRLLGLTAALFLAGLGWRSAQAHLSLSPLEVRGTPLEWTSQAVEVSDSMEDAQAPAVPKSQHAQKITGTLNPNTANLVQLESLPGIGPALAKRIADARTESPYLSSEDLLRVKGIGPAKLDKLRPHLTF